MLTERFHFIEAVVRYRTEEEGGRRSPVRSGYRGQFHYGADNLGFDGFQYFPDLADDEWVPQGARFRAVVRFWRESWDRIHAMKISVGMRFSIQEGNKVVGEGEVTKMETDTATAQRFST